MKRPLLLASATALLLTAGAAPAQQRIKPVTWTERPATPPAKEDTYGYVRRVVDIPMRDGIKLHTVIAIPKGAHDAGILMTRTPYDAEKRSAITPVSTPRRPRMARPATMRSPKRAIFASFRTCAACTGRRADTS